MVKMGEIIIKVPGDVKEIININFVVSPEEIFKKIEEIINEREEKVKVLKEITERYQGKLNIPEVREDELYE